MIHIAALSAIHFSAAFALGASTVLSIKALSDMTRPRVSRICQR
jgi:hypothetical protein